MRNNPSYNPIPMNYRFAVRPDNSWVLHIAKAKGRRLMGKGDPYKDNHYSEFLDGLCNGEVSEILPSLLKKHGIYEEPVLLDADKSGFKFIKGDVAHNIEIMGLLLQKLVDCYCYK